MKTKVLFLFAALLSVFFVSSCSQQPPGLALESAPAPAAQGDLRKVPTPKAQQRPGLATGWGDEKKSDLSYTSFTRSSSSPYSKDLIYYNDPEGIKAMAGNPRKVSGLQTAAGETIEWGIKSGFRFLPTFRENGYGRRLVSAKKGSTYSIVVKNRCKSPLEIVASVDGLDVQTGTTASFSKRGYIIAPGKTLEIKGFRKSNSSVAAFEFSSVGNSYANLKHGNTRNVGVIGIAVFTPKNANLWGRNSGEVNRRNSASPFATAP